MKFEVQIHQFQSLMDYCEDEYGQSNDDRAASSVAETLERSSINTRISMSTPASAKLTPNY
ncbi:hypothetical protein SAMN04489841_2570 [Natrinema salaciae]|uniref:Uncharacterized protein n=1 Tax=Natrinema salaciae TaxID=1186196 RepID=A0A1H9JIH3_9EURY|nr:hypothetical protein SAMN04489841_2570 [Natrinema salaciae]